MSVGKIRKIEHWEYWYDRSYKCWFAAETDENGDLTDKESLNAYHREDIELYIRRELEDDETS